MYFAGIDIGSVSTDVVIIDKEAKIKGYEIVPTGSSFNNAAEKGMEGALNKANIKKKDVSKIVSTGYGRKNIKFSEKSMTEIKCHAIGAFNINSDIRTIVDIGGQDCKVISLKDDGGVQNFLMNDKCSAGTGRFIEIMARALEIDLNKIGPLSLKANGTCRISSICTVFAESEVISKLSENIKREDIIKGIHISIGERILTLVNRLGTIRERIAITGGGGKNIGIVDVLEQTLKTEVITFDNPQIIGAFGAAIEARKLQYN